MKLEEYEVFELNIINKEIVSLHEKYDLGVCLRLDVHKLFHKEYGKGKNTIQQWQEFEQDFKNNKYTKGIDY